MLKSRLRRAQALLAAVAVIAAVWAPSGLRAQEGWNAPRALALVDQARTLRQSVIQDRTFQAYRADARGYVYFFLDREDTDERVLVKTDQVALEVYWQAPDRTRQRIVGLRDEERLPTNIRYHLDHLTVVQDEFADVIRLGDGDEVSAVVHPMGTGAETVYDYHLADSITLSYGNQREIRVYELEVKPKNLDAPGFLGSVFLSRETAAIVRMNFTFTPASYVDDYLDYIRISLDNSVWDEQFWLPYEQSVELRREVPYLDFPAGSVIRGRYEIRNYRFDPDLDPSFFLGPRVTALPEAARRAFPFERPLHAQVDEEGLATLPDLSEVRATAARLAGRQALSGLGRSRLWLPSASSALRYDRAEGLAVGAGYSFRVDDATTLRAGGGWAFGRERPHGRLQLERPVQGLTVDAFWNRVRDIGPFEGSSGATNTLATLAAGSDYLDPYFTTGVEARWEGRRDRRTRPWVTLAWERQRQARTVVGVEAAATGAVGADLHRPVRSIREGDALRASLGMRYTLTSAAELGGGLELGHLNDETWGKASLEAHARREWLERGVRLDWSAWGGWAFGDLPPQALYLLGGRSTLPGYAYRGWVGDRFGLTRLEVSHAVRAPWARVGGLFALGTTRLGEGRTPPPDWNATPNPIWSGSAGVFGEFLWDVLRVDLARGLGGGEWQLLFSVTRRFHRWL